ncbi:ABC transporter substrate-binding protein, partial [Leptolyngbya sp. FACHB-36]|uniref:ABC transporter substrate-binding protein n=1 Tax=Leptolyngbya sp. FACHB-36 TaxID=2692808 RepID=UPI00198ABFB4
MAVKVGRRSWGVRILAIVWVIVLAGCSGSAAISARPSQLVAVTSNDPKTFNCALVQELPTVGGFICEGLIFENGQGQIEPDLAESWTVSDDKRTVVFTLRSDLKWSDGHPLTAEDVVFSYRDVYLNPKLSVPAQDSFKIGPTGAFPTVRKLDDRRVEFKLPEPFAPFIRSTGGGGGAGAAILPAHKLRDAVNTLDSRGQSTFLATWGTDTDPTAVIVNGPYRIASYSPSQRVVFERNPFYWRKDAQGRSQPYIDRIVWQIVQSGDTALIQFRSGSVDLLGVGPASFSLLKR